MSKKFSKPKVKVPSRVIRQTPDNPKKEGYSAMQWMAIAVVVIMVFSTIAFGLLSSFNNAPASETQPEAQAPSAIQFSAQIEAKVAELLPVFKLFADTSQTDITKLDAMVLGVPGVVQMASSFRQDSSRGNSLVYAADIVYNKEQFSLKEILDGITENSQGELLNIVVLSSALLEVPQKVEFQNETLGLTKEHIFLDQLVQGLVYDSTQKGDAPQVQLDATFTGVSLTELNAFELFNPATQPTDRLGTRPLKVLSLEPGLFFTADANFSDEFTSTALKADLQEINDINSTEFYLSPTGPLNFSVDAEINLVSFEAFLNELSAAAELNSLSQERPFRFSMQIESTEQYQSVIHEIQAELDTKGILPEQLLVEPFPVLIEARLGLAQSGLENSINVGEQVKTVLSDKFSELTVYQIGAVKADTIKESIADPDSQEFVVPGGRIQALLFPGTNIDAEILATVQYQTVRNEVIFAFATQVAAPTIP